jgi:hypothetical protein
MGKAKKPLDRRHSGSRSNHNYANNIGTQSRLPRQQLAAQFYSSANRESESSEESNRSIISNRLRELYKIQLKALEDESVAESQDSFESQYDFDSVLPEATVDPLIREDGLPESEEFSHRKKALSTFYEDSPLSKMNHESLTETSGMKYEGKAPPRDRNIVPYTRERHSKGNEPTNPESVPFQSTTPPPPPPPPAQSASHAPRSLTPPPPPPSQQQQRLNEESKSRQFQMDPSALSRALQNRSATPPRHP